MKHVKLLFLVLFLAPACVSFGDGEIENPRMGDMGRVVFEGPGCQSSTTLALGSTAELTLQPREGVLLPADLSVASVAPEVIGAHLGDEADRVVLEARSIGESYIEIHSGGDVWDGLAFSAEPAASVEFEAAPAALAGGTLRLKVTAAYGACGEECPLIGSGFIEWDGGEALSLHRDHDREASFHVERSPGVIELAGYEPATGALLVSHTVEVVPLEEAGELEAQVVALLPDDELELRSLPRELPAELPVGSLFQPQMRTVREGGSDIPLTIREVTWTIESGEELVEAADEEDEEPSLEGPIFHIIDTGELVLVAEVPLLETTRRYTIALNDPPVEEPAE